MRPTRRGWATAVVVVAAVVLAAKHGSRSLNALVVPLVVVGVAAIVTVARVDRPRVDRRPVSPGFVGEVRTVELVVTADRSVSATVVDGVGDGLEVPANTVELTLSGETIVAYDVVLAARGAHDVGPTTIVVRDVLGLVRRRFEAGRRESVLVYPPVYELRGEAMRDLAAIANAAREHDRTEFDQLREYERGDPLRDVHWKSAAKRPNDDLVVKEFVADEAFERVSIVAGAAPGHDDEMAAAAATLAMHLLDLGVGIDVIVPDDRRVQATSDTRDRVLRLLATAGHGEIADRRRDAADVIVRSNERETVVVLGDRSVPFARMRSDVDVDGIAAANADADVGAGGGVAVDAASTRGSNTPETDDTSEVIP